MKKSAFFLISPIYFSIWIPGIVKKREMRSRRHDFGYNCVEYEVSQGLHAFLKYSTVEAYFQQPKENIYKAVIPKGSKYYISINREFIVSNKMKILRK